MKNYKFIYILSLFIFLLASQIQALALENIKINNKSINITINDIKQNDLSSLNIDSLGLYFEFKFVSSEQFKFEVESIIHNSQLISKDISFSKFIKFTQASVKNINKKLFKNFKIYNLGSYQGISLYQIRIYPVFFSDNKLNKVINQDVIINFNKEITLNHNYIDLSINNYFNDIINSQHLSYLSYLETRSNQNILNKKNNNLQDLYTIDYNPNIDYIEVSTDKDGIGFITLKDILTANDNILIQVHKYKYLHLTKNGYDIPYYVDSKDGLINSADTIFFESSRNKGDTTYFDHYNKYQKFYLFYDENYESTHLQKQEYKISNNLINNVQTTFHFEKDSIYLDGQSGDTKDEHFLDPSTGPGEGWFESHFRPNLYKDFNKSADTLKEFNKLIFPADNSNIEFKFAFFSTKINDRLENNHKIKTEINNLFTDTEVYKFIRNDYYKYKINTINSNSLFYANNTLKYTAIPLLDEYLANATNEDGAMGFDYLSISGNFLPIVIDDQFIFRLENPNTESNIEIFPFSSDKVLAISPENNLIFDYKAQKGFSITINTSNVLSKTEFYINNKLTYSDDRIGFHLLYLDENYKIKSEYFADDKIDLFISYINNIKIKSSVAIAINTLNLTTLQLDLLRSINLIIDNYSPNNCIAHIINISEKSSKGNKFSSEKSESNIAKYIDFIPDEKADNYKISIFIPKGKYEKIIVSDISKLVPTILEKSNKSDLKNLENQCNYLIISSKHLSKSAIKYKEYREFTHKNIKTNIVYVEDIFKEFSYGKRSPEAIKEFISYAYNNWKINKLNTILLLGDASLDPRQLLTSNKMIDHVPSFGMPMSDTWYTMMDGDEDFIADINISRIPLQTNEDFDNYFEKLEVFEKKSNAVWKNSILFMIGGADRREQSSFEVYQLQPLLNQMKFSNICFDYEIIKKSMDNKVSESVGPEIIQALNKGKMFTFFVGHGSAEVLDMEGWMPSNLGNYWKNGLFFASSCSMGAFGLEKNYTRFEQLLFVPKGGFIFTVGNSTADYPEFSSLVAKGTFKSIFENNERNFLKAFNWGKTYSLSNFPDSRWLRSLQRYCLTGTCLGDPFINFPYDTTAELFLLVEEFKIYSNSGNSTITENDEYLNIDFVVRNSGIKNFDSVKVNIIDKYQNKLDTFQLTLYSVCPAEAVYKYSIPIKGKIGHHFLTIFIDPDSTILEHRKDNNILSRQFEVVQNSILALDPMPNWNIKLDDLHFRFINPIPNFDSLRYDLAIYKDNNSSALIRANNEHITIHNNVIDWKPNISLSENENYRIEASFTDPKLGQSYPANIPFYASSKNIDENVELKINKSELNKIYSDNLIFDNNSNSLKIKNDSVKIDFTSISGTDLLYPHRVYKGIYLSINDVYYISEPILIGTYIAKFNNDFSKFEIKFFNTWGIYSDADSYKDSSSIELVNYLKDSVKVGDNIFLGTTGSAFRLFSLHNKLNTNGSWDTLKTVLNNWGAKFANTIDTSTINKFENAWGYSYVFFAHISNGETISYDKVNLYGDTAQIVAHLPITYKNAKFSINVNHIDKLNDFKLNYTNPKTNIKVDHKLFAKNKESNNLELIKDFPDNKLINSNKNETLLFDYPKNSDFNDYYFEYDVSSIDSEILDFGINELSINYTPLPELDIYQLNQLDSNILKADPDTLSLQIRNLSLRNKIDSIKLQIDVNDKSQSIDKIDTLFYNINKNTDIKFSYNLNTDNYSDTVSILSKIIVLNKPDIYLFNNDVSQIQIFKPDTIKPTIELEVDGHIVSNNEFVGKNPEFKVLVKDNSKRNINSDDNISVKINLKYINKDNMNIYEFKSYPKDTNLRATLRFKPDSLDYDENIIRIIAEDANQNKDTVLYRLNVSRQGYLKHISIHPNPAKENSIIFFNFAAPAIDGYAQIEIFDAIGRKVKYQKSKLNIGNNNIPITLKGENNEKLALGVYYYKVSIINTEIIAEPMIDKFVIVE